jgi:HD-GYP domain-containing protein (c-di-GMP phosphodiesterase class II)
METKTHISLSIGHAAGNGGSIDMHALFREADNRMYREKMQRERSSRSHIVQALMKAMEARDFVTEGHSDRLQQLVLPLARSRGLPEDAINDLLLFSRFHDLGKVGIPDSILGKPGALTEEEAEEMRKHSEIGHRIAKSVPDLAPIADLILKHHEWWNGRGYPLGLAGEDIPLPCRILAIADAFDAMTSDRPYRRAMSREKAVEELRASAGSQFDPELVEQFVATLDCRTAHRVTSTKQTG